MSYEETIDYLYSLLPVFHREGKTAFKADLKNTLAFCDYLGNPHQKIKTIHVAGTNGKGSTSSMLSAILQSAGYKTGLYTSPHLKSYTERFRINGVPIPENYVVNFVEEHRSFIEVLMPSFFELSVAMAFDYFAKEQVDVAVIEVGLGGRLDSTNVISPILSIITNIGWDHMDLLGDTLEKIATEKAGIIKKNIPVVISEWQNEAIATIFVQKAKEQESKIDFANHVFDVQETFCTPNNQIVYTITKDKAPYLTDLTLDLIGNYQANNLLGVLLACEWLNKVGIPVSELAIRRGLSSVQVLAGLKGRWQVLQSRPLIVCDTAHNEPGIQRVLHQLQSIPKKQLFFVLGFVKDKDIRTILALFPTEASYFFCQSTTPRALNTSMLQSLAAEFGLIGEAIPNPNQALEIARRMAGEEDVIYVGGSTFVVAEIADL
ncbi:MAG: folylpolyglutamate synthase/dihydrofolate synthase family protein [Spirosomataceae bacterium]